MKQSLRNELYLGLVIFPVTFAIGKGFELFASPDTLDAATRYQSAFVTDLSSFTPVTFVGRIWEINREMALVVVGKWPDFTDIDSVMAALLHALPFLLKLPLLIFVSILSVLLSFWSNDTLLASILVTLTFIVAIPLGIALAGAFAEGMGLWGLVPTTAAIYLVGTVACTILWGITWAGITLFGWFTEVAGLCTVGGGFAAAIYFVGVQYAGFRAAHSAEKVLNREPDQPKDEAAKTASGDAAAPQ